MPQWHAKKEGAGENGSNERVAIEHQTLSAALLHSNKYKLPKANGLTWRVFQLFTTLII